MKYSDTQNTEKVLSMAKTFSESMRKLTGGECLVGGSLARCMKIEQWDNFNDVDLFVTDIPDIEKAIKVLTKEGWVPMVEGLKDYLDFTVLEKEHSGVQYQAILNTDSLDEIVRRTCTSLSWFFYKLERVLQDGKIMTKGYEYTHCRTALANELIRGKIALVDQSLTRGVFGLQRKYNTMTDLLGYKTFEYRRDDV